MSEGTIDVPMEAPSASVHGDSVAAVLLLLVVMPLMGLLWLGIRATGQPPLFLQRRVGYRGEDFTIYKFRTIPAEGWDAFERSASDVRVRTYRSLAALMRATGLDELPQLWNVARGEMRIVGPRPLTREDFEALPDYRHLRCMGHPGITGLAQVNGGQALDPASKLVLDIYQLECMHPGLWVRIALRSAGRILGFTSMVAVPCPVTIARARNVVARRLQGADVAALAQLDADLPAGMPRLDGSVT
jgi:lipopolysaccharide/colanic/teichoic acid biosynthesis glycosyltransferase